MTKNLKRISSLCLVLFGIALQLVTGCSADGDPGPDADAEYFVRFKCNGVQKTYKAHSVAQTYFDEKNDVYRCNIIGSTEILNTHDAMSLFLVAEDSYVTGISYKLATEVEMAGNGAIMPQVTAVYLDESGKGYTAQFLQSDWYDFKDQAEVTFTEITDKYFKGTFSARVFTAMPEREELQITDGEFYVSVYK